MATSIIANNGAAPIVISSARQDITRLPASTQRLSKLLVLAIFIVALAPRLAFIALKGPRVAPDTPYYTRLATNISQHVAYSLDSAAPFSPSIRIAPLYPAFLAVLSFFRCDNSLAVAVSQSILDSFAAVLLLLLGRTVLTIRWAAAAALSYCLHPGAIYAASNILTETLFTAALLAAVCLLCAGLIKNRMLLTLGAGVALGCAILCRAIVLPLPLMLSAVLLCAHRLIGTPRSVLPYIFVFLLGTALVVVPWTIRCSLVAGSLVPVQAAGAANFYIPTRWEWDQGDESHLWPRFVEQDPYGQRLYAAQTPREMMEADSLGYGLAMRNIGASPREYLASRIRNYPHLFLISFDTFTGINASFGQLARQGDARLLIKLFLLLSFSLVPFLAGVRSVFLRQNLVSVVCLSVWTYTLLVHLPMWIEYRFWQPAVPFLLISAALTGHAISSRWRRTEPLPGQAGASHSKETIRAASPSGSWLSGKVSLTKKAALYVCYYNLYEPLVQTQVLPYLRHLATWGIDIHLLTFERAPRSIEERQSILAELAVEGITWHYVRYHVRPSLPATLYDIAIGTVMSAFICKKHRIHLVHARSHVPAAIGLVLKSLLGSHFLFDMRGLLGEEYADSGRWKRGRVKFKLTQRMERTFFRAADGIVMLTERIKRDLTLTRPELRNRHADIEVIPCCVDTERFVIPEEDRSNYRRARGWDARIVLTYAGKLGGWYLTDEMARFFAAARRDDPRFFFQVLTQSDPDVMARALAAHGVNPADYDIRYASPSGLPLTLASSDAGISFIRATYSKLASSPTKLGEYLAAGLPVVAAAGIGDCDRLLRDNRLGVILDSRYQAAYQAAARELKALINEPGIRLRCQRVAEQELSLSKVGGPRYVGIYRKLFRQPIATASTAPYERVAGGSGTREQIL